MQVLARKERGRQERRRREDEGELVCAGVLVELQLRAAERREREVRARADHVRLERPGTLRRQQRDLRVAARAGADDVEVAALARREMKSELLT